MKKNIFAKFCALLLLIVLMTSFIPAVVFGDLGDDLGDEIGDDLGDEIGDDIGDEIGDGLGDEIGDDLGDEIGDDLSDEVGDEIGDEIGDDLGDEIGDDLDFPAEWEDLQDQTIPYNSPDNTLVYSNITDLCNDLDENEYITIESTHSNYDLDILDNNIIVKNLSFGYIGTEIVILRCNGVPANFQLTVEAPSGDYPTANAGGPYYAVVEEIIYFDASASTDNDKIVRYKWNFGDDQNMFFYETQPFINHAYKEAGNYQVTLTVTDSDGLESQAITYAYIVDGPLFYEPTANFKYNPWKPNADEMVRFEDTSSDEDGYLINWYWDFGDGSIAYTKNPQHQYDKDGEYHVTLTVWDNDGLSDSLTRVIRVDDEGKSSVSLSERTIFSRIRYNEYAYAGDIVKISIGVLNDGTHNMEDVRVTAHILDLGARRTAGPFEIDDNQEETANLYLEIPADAQPGEYDLRIVASNDDFRHIEHRTITIE